MHNPEKGALVISPRRLRREDTAFICAAGFLLGAVGLSQLGVAWLFAPLGLLYFLVNLVLAYRVAAVDPFDPLAWFMFASGVLFGVGILPLFLLPISSADFIQDTNAAVDLIGAVVTISYLAGACVIGTVALINRYWGYRDDSGPQGYGFDDLLQKADRYWRAFAVAAGVAVLLCLAYYATGASLGTGLIVRASTIVSALFGLVFGYSVAKADRAKLVVGTALMAAAIVVGFLDLYKISVLLPLAGLTAGFVLKRGITVASCLAAAALAATYLLVIQPVVTQSRSAGSYAIQDMTLADRVDAVTHGIGAIGKGGGGLEQLFRRTSMIHFQAFAIDRYDRGLKSDSMNEWYWGFAPRALFPEKPSISRYGGEFYMLYSGSTQPSTSLPMTYMVKAYANGGYGFVVAVAILFGAQLALLRHLMQAALRRRSVLVIVVAPAVAYYATGLESPFTMHMISMFIFVLSGLMLVNLIAVVRDMRLRTVGVREPSG